MIPALPEPWQPLLGEAWLRPSLDPLRQFVLEEYRSRCCYPPPPHLFRALELTPPQKVKAVILGQDPYHGAGQAHGLAFSVQPGVRPPASLVNIFKELKSDVGITAPPGLGDLTPWAERGVLLLNTVLSVRDAEPLSHRNRGWETFTDAILQAVNSLPSPVVFVLWGAHAQKKLPLIDAAKHAVIQSAHPSPLSARNGFFGSRPFSRINEALRQFGREAIDWNLEEPRTK